MSIANLFWTYLKEEISVMWQKLGSIIKAVLTWIALIGGVVAAIAAVIGLVYGFVWWLPNLELRMINAIDKKIDEKIDGKIIPLIDNIHLSLLEQDKILCDRLLAVEKKLDIDTETGREQKNNIDETIRALKHKKYGLSQKYGTKDSVVGIIKSPPTNNTIKLKNLRGTLVEYWITDSTRILTIKEGKETKGSLKDIETSKAAFIVPASDGDNSQEIKKVNLILISPNNDEE